MPPRADGVEDARPAGPEDLARLGELTVEATAEQVDARGGAIWSVREARAIPATGSLRDALEDPDHLVVVGTIDDVVVGYAVVRAEVLRNGATLGVVTDVYTEPGARAVGVGEAMIGAVIGWCEDRGCVGIDALALPGNRATKNFFETFGFTARAIVVHRRLGGGTPG
jgi:GNAT superfamily N-acetyltransferase